ncbi:hypothetical protein C3943_10750 [Lysinibacillus sp. B2A1]|nr:hypothetical protein C3943_10750 [Lysinibacillus sp. B2A1]
MKTCFIVCPIGNEGSETRKNSDTVLKHIIQPVCQELHFQVIRVDQIYGTDRIDNTIYEHLKTADLIIADMSEYNPNAFYEIGYRHALGKPLIPIMKEGTDIPFDLASLRTITYATDNLDKASAAKERLAETINSFDFSIEQNEKENEPVHQNITPYLLKIQDEIEDLKGIMLKRNDEFAKQTVELAIEQIQKNTAAPENKFAEILMKEIANDPKKFKEFDAIFKNLS